MSTQYRAIFQEEKFFPVTHALELTPPPLSPGVVGWDSEIKNLKLAAEHRFGGRNPKEKSMKYK